MPHAQVRDGRGAPVPALETTDGVVFEAQRPDVYTVIGEDRRIQVIANVLDPRQAEINRSRLGDRDVPARAGEPAVVRSSRQRCCC